MTAEEEAWATSFFSGKTLTDTDKTWIDTMSSKIKTQDNWIVAGNGNIPYYSGGTEIVYGSGNSRGCFGPSEPQSWSKFYYCRTRKCCVWYRRCGYWL